MVYGFVFMHMRGTAFYDSESYHTIGAFALLVMHAKLRQRVLKLLIRVVFFNCRTGWPNISNWFSESAIRGWIVTPVILMQLHLTTRLLLCPRISVCAFL
ncbi:hypothetical protein CEXT_409971 [Caerostris extrusa]|uniref:Uncharacterized protein n=1 Tax=Caerostris extrusa TaxID=172846 RepID=A0AAV4XMF0_CAEEX|nr:hypothetical protein CEXT_409971 [Caerostris extrusa]